MKKFIAVLLSLSLLLTMMSLSASAAELEQQGYENLINKTISVFPEYAGKLLNPTYSPSESTRTSSPRTLIVKETRPFSNTESITYSEYSDGLILLSAYDVDYETETVGPIPQPNLSVRNFTINITATSVVTGYNGYFYLNGVSYAINAGLNNFDSITNFGTGSKGTNCTRAVQTDDEPNETKYGYARLQYDLAFRVGPHSGDFITTELIMHVGEDTAVIDHSVWG